MSNPHSIQVIKFSGPPADHNVSATALLALHQQLGSPSNMMQLNLNACLQNNENCKKALQCAEKGLTNPRPFPSSNWLTDFFNTMKELKNLYGGGKE